MVRPSISRVIIPPPRRRITRNPVISINESPKSVSTRSVCPRERVSNISDERNKRTPRKTISEINLLRSISRKVLSAILNIKISGKYCIKLNIYIRFSIIFSWIDFNASGSAFFALE